MNPELAQVNAKLDALLELVRGKPQPHLTFAEFARRVGVHPNTVTRWVRNRDVITQKGRIPYSELRKFLS